MLETALKCAVWLLKLRVAWSDLRVYISEFPGVQEAAKQWPRLLHINFRERVVQFNRNPGESQHTWAPPLVLLVSRWEEASWLQAVRMEPQQLRLS